MYGGEQNAMSLLLKVTMFGIRIRIGDFRNQVGLFCCFRFIHGYLAPPPAVSPRHESLVDRDPRQPSGKGRSPLEFLQVNKRFLKALLNDIFGVLAVTSDPQDGDPPVAFNEKFKCLVVAALGGCHEPRVICSH
jgi:hypothetical protein